MNKQDPSANCTTFQGALDWAKKRGDISEATEDAFWTVLLSDQGLDENLIAILKLVYFNESTKMIEGYTVTNPDGETSNTYGVTENGTYTFKIQDIGTGKTYTKKVEVTNIDKSLPALTVTSEIIEKTVGSQKEYRVFILLKDLKTNEYVDFEKAYILFNNKKIEITPAISTKDGKKGIFAQKITGFLYDEGLNREKDLMYTNQTIILEKDNKEYTSSINMGRFYI